MLYIYIYILYAQICIYIHSTYLYIYHGVQHQAVLQQTRARVVRGDAYPEHAHGTALEPEGSTTTSRSSATPVQRRQGAAIRGAKGVTWSPRAARCSSRFTAEWSLHYKLKNKFELNVGKTNRIRAF